MASEPGRPAHLDKHNPLYGAESFMYTSRRIDEGPPFEDAASPEAPRTGAGKAGDAGHRTATLDMTHTHSAESDATTAATLNSGSGRDFMLEDALAAMAIGDAKLLGGDGAREPDDEASGISTDSHSTYEPNFRAPLYGDGRDHSGRESRSSFDAASLGDLARVEPTDTGSDTTLLETGRHCFGVVSSRDSSPRQPVHQQQQQLQQQQLQLQQQQQQQQQQHPPQHPPRQLQHSQHELHHHQYEEQRSQPHQHLDQRAQRQQQPSPAFEQPSQQPPWQLPPISRMASMRRLPVPDQSLSEDLTFLRKVATPVMAPRGSSASTAIVASDAMEQRSEFAFGGSLPQQDRRGYVRSDAASHDSVEASRYDAAASLGPAGHSRQSSMSAASYDRNLGGSVELSRFADSRALAASYATGLFRSDRLPSPEHMRRVALPPRPASNPASVVAIPNINALRITLMGPQATDVSEDEFADFLRSFHPVNSWIHARSEHAWDADIEFAADNTGNLICEQLLQEAGTGRRMFRNTDVRISRPPPVVRQRSRPMRRPSLPEGTTGGAPLMHHVPGNRQALASLNANTDTAHAFYDGPGGMLGAFDRSNSFAPPHDSFQYGAAHQMSHAAAPYVPAGGPNGAYAGSEHHSLQNASAPVYDTRRAPPPMTMTMSTASSSGRFPVEPLHYSSRAGPGPPAMGAGGMRGALALPHAQPTRPCDLMTPQIVDLITDRIHARRARRFQRADEILYQLRNLGVELYDSPHNKWFASDGRSGDIDVNIAPAVGPCELGTEEIEEVVAHRLSMRRNRNFREADRMKEFLLVRGVVVDDRNNCWRASDSREGTIE